MSSSSISNNKDVINVITLGCSKNIVDSENLMGTLRRGGMKVVHDAPGDGFAGVIINTCGFILDAKEESIESILDYAQARTEGRIGKLVVMGCLAQRYRNQLMEEIPELDAVLGVDELSAVASLFLGSGKLIHWKDRLLTTPPHYAYQKISEGCDHQCSFCAIPLIRGKHQSRDVADIVNEAVSLKKKGVKELILIAQDLTWYGMDLEGRKMLPELLRKLDAEDTPEWIRLHYTYPVGFPLEILDIMKQSEKFCNYLDIPLQHISNRILKSMRRGGSGDAVRSLIQSVRENYPELALRTTMIVGYPGETEEEFNELLDFVKETRFDRLGAFVYSHEEDTPAFKHTDDVSPELKEERLSTLMAVQQRIAEEKNQDFLRKTIKLIIDREEDEFYVGRTQYDSPEVDNEVLVRKSAPLKIGYFYDVTVDEAGVFELYAQPVGASD